MSLSRRRFLMSSTSLLMCTPGLRALETTEKLIDKKGQVFRDYDSAPEHVIRFYQEQHRHQTYAFAKAKREHYSQLNQGQSTAWDMLERLDTIRDNSDPDINLSQMEHAFQVAESLKQLGLPEDMVLAGLVHDMGKALVLWGEPQWAVVGDTFPTGMKYSETIVQHSSLRHNPDMSVPEYQTDFGVYHEGIGLDNVIMTWGHDEYLYQVLKDQSRLSPQALFAIRFHSCYPLHKAGEPRYLALMNDSDRRYLSAAQTLNQHDLYSKSDTAITRNSEVTDYYRGLVDRYIPGKLRW